MDALEILFEDDFLVAVLKPSGVATHQGEGHEQDNLLTRLRAQLRARGEADTEQIAPVHRLDRGTSGIVVFGRAPVVVKAFHDALEKGQVRRRYLALVQGVAHRKGTIRVPLSRHEARGRRAPRGRAAKAPPGKVAADAGDMQEAETRYRRLLYTRAATLLRVSPRTGRPHQIRRHLKGIGHPIAGDDRWGDVGFNRWIAGQHGLDRLFLHATSLTFPHPISGAPVTLECPLPKDLQAVLDSLEFPPLESAESDPPDPPGSP